MRHLSIDYKISELQKDDITKLENLITQYEKSYFDKFRELFSEYNIPEINVVLTEDVWFEIKEFYIEKEVPFSKLPPKGLVHIAEIVKLKGETIHFWNSTVFSDATIKIFFNMLIENLVQDELVKKYNLSEGIRLDQGIDSLVEQLSQTWSLFVTTKSLCEKVIQEGNLSYESMEDLTFAFKRNIKKLHYNYQKEPDNYKFLLSAIMEFEVYIRRILSYKSSKNFFGLDEFEREINNITSENERITIEDLHNNGGKILTSSKESILEILKKCDIELYEDSETKSIGFKVQTGPKKLFPSLIDTEPRIVCFLDVLGFKELILEYERENASLVLKRLKKAFESSRLAALDILLKIFGLEKEDEIEARMFSDCIVISTKYIEFGVDVKISIYHMAIILNVFQQTFMREGFYLRGHITIGSYYSNQNMLFSGGMVEAYQNEASTVYPAISINTKIIEKLKHKTEFDNSLPTLNKLIIEHDFEEASNRQILNPLFTLENYKNIDSQINKTIKEMTGFDPLDFGLELSFKSLFENELGKIGLDNIESEIEKDKDLIFSKLIEEYNRQIEIYRVLRNSHEKRFGASRVMDKLMFLIKLFTWLNGEPNPRFSFVELEGKENTA